MQGLAGKETMHLVSHICHYRRPIPRDAAALEHGASLNGKRDNQETMEATVRRIKNLR